MSKRNQRYQMEAVAEVPVQDSGLADLVAAWRAQADDMRRMAANYNNGCQDHALRKNTHNMRAFQLRKDAEELEAVINGSQSSSMEEASGRTETAVGQGFADSESADQGSGQVDVSVMQDDNHDA